MVGSMRLEMYRIVLALVLLTAVINYRHVLHRADLTDLLLLLLIGLTFASFWHNHGMQKAIESTGILAIETLGAFYLARLYVSSPQRFFKVNQFFISVLALLTVFAVYEAFTHHRILHDIARAITGHDSLDPRLYTYDYVRAGLLRATSLFAHPILYGTLMALFFPFAVLWLWRQRNLHSFLNVGGLGLSMLLTLSSAPVLTVIFQSITAVVVRFWHSAKYFWIALISGAAAAALFIEAVSNRGFFALLISYLTFNPHTGYSRLLQWEHAADDIARNPVFGIGHNTWERPESLAWLGSSIDSFWLLLSLQHGLFALLLLLLACLYTVFNTLNLVHRHHPDYRWMVSAWVLSFISLILIGFTVDYFGKLQPLFFFMLGSIGWARYYPLWNQQAKELASQTPNDIKNMNG